MLRRVKNQTTRKMLFQLIKEEHQHEVHIKERLLALGGEIDRVEFNFDLPNRGQMLDLELDNFSASELINLVIQNEKISRDYYLAQRDRVSHPQVKEIFQWLVDEENEHIKSLVKDQDCHDNYESVCLPSDDED
ncbi:MAG: hypothetical protein Kow0037_10500 [Calditrichia bacterium]